MFSIAFHNLLYRPILNSLFFLYAYLPGHDFGVAIIFLTLFVKTILFPLSWKSIKSQKAIQEIQPKIKEIQKKFKNNKEEQAKALMELYKKEGINPFSGCLPLLIQLPILIALFLALKSLSGGGLKPDLFYSFVPFSSDFSPFFLGRIDLTVPFFPLAILAGVFQFIQSKMLVSQPSSEEQNDISQIMQKQSLYFFPIFTIMILWKLPAAIGLYWLTSTLFSIGQQYLIIRNYSINGKEN